MAHHGRALWPGTTEDEHDHYGKAFLANPAGIITQGGNIWFDGFAGPWIAEVAPKALVAERTITLVVGRSPRTCSSRWAGCCSGSPCCARVGPLTVPVAIIAAGAL